MHVLKNLKLRTLSQDGAISGADYLKLAILFQSLQRARGLSLEKLQLQLKVIPESSNRKSIEVRAGWDAKFKQSR